MLDDEFMNAQAESDINIKDKLKDLKEAEEKLNKFESDFKAEMDKNHKDYEQVLTSYKDMYSDPFKRHDENHNPFDSDEEREIKHNLKKQEGANNINNLWLYEDKNLEKLRIGQDNKISKKFLDWELLKRGVVPEKFRQNIQKVTLDQYRPEQLYADNLISKNDHEDPLLRNNVKYEKGRNASINYGTKQFIEDYLGKGKKFQIIN